MTTEPLTTSGTARKLLVSEATVRNWAATGRLRPVAVTASGVRLFDPVAIDRLAQQLAEKRAKGEMRKSA